MHWPIPQDCLQPTSSDITYQSHILWLRASHDPLIFESVIALVQMANSEGQHNSLYKALDLRTMDCPKGAELSRVDPHSVFGRAPFEVQSVDSGWLLEHSSGAPLGYVHAQWGIHCPMRPELDPTLGLDFRLHTLMIRPSLKGHGFSSMMTTKVVEAIGQHVDLLMASHSRLRGLSWIIRCDADTVNTQGEGISSHLDNRINEMLRERSHSSCSMQPLFA